MNLKKIFLPFLLAVLFVSFFNPSKISEPIKIAKAATPSTPALPVHLIIPDAKVDTNIINVGIRKDGKLDTPNNYIDVGWYKFGALPGNLGSAVLDGHVDNGAKVPGPFKNLRNLEIGGDIYVTMDNGSVLHYQTISRDIYSTDKFPGEKVFHENDLAYLKIITCHGKFIPSKNTYDQRLVVTAVLVG